MIEKVDRVQSMGDHMGVLRRRWPYLVTIVPTALLVALFFAFGLPAIYRSSATILLEPSSIAPELVKTTVVSYADQQIELVKRTVMTVDRLESITKEIDPYPDQPQVSAHDKAEQIIASTFIQKVDPITMEPLVISSAFSINYDNRSSKLAAAVTQRIADLFLNYNRTTRVAQARQAREFLKVQSDQLNATIVKLEQRISEFKTRYGGALPESRDHNEYSLDRAQRDLDSTEAEIRVIAQQESLLKLQLSQTSPSLVASGTDAYTQLGLLRSELAAAKQKYTPDHPDVKRLTRAIEALAEQAKLGGGVVVRPDNPEYLRISSQLNAIQVNLAALRSNAARARVQISDYDRRLGVAPTVERDYAQLTRDHEIARQQFGEVQTKLQAAETAQALETGSQGERYTLIRPATVPTSPASPNRLGIVLIGLILGSALAVGLAVLREAADPTVRSSRDLADLGGLQVIGAIPMLHNAAETRRRRLVWGSVAGAYLVASIGVVLTVLN
jgi:succinoglycan biosynthesis transport protein ExoP